MCPRLTIFISDNISEKKWEKNGKLAQSGSLKWHFPPISSSKWI